mmetsp:Transcript_20298/g.29999  ORF Transcript_20298/g.29999 Transcript_20298/m.29999 type:complete len:436 (+) Transcript_20298:132-1439(+)|eukprot:CAMPEP_0171462082 /NCGR_PEP_ID=MMETSP0945-20130129/6266_1 /TAXON_ID=109269 /ORGANISM="Vaucheria litorea, Strain CCMP2940" /LENGTH=435 /DNA_ID=CAMNT_0011988545 /DNA_START=73 /DNA_END=1380 /DNA_ORIENTATION=-
MSVEESDSEIIRPLIPKIESTFESEGQPDVENGKIEEGLQYTLSARDLNSSQYFPRSKNYKSEGESPNATKKNENAQNFPSKIRMPKRGGRKRIRRKQFFEKRRVSSYCISNEIQIEALFEYLQLKHERELKDDGSGPVWIDALYSDVIHCTTHTISSLEINETKDLKFDPDYDSQNETERENKDKFSLDLQIMIANQDGKDIFILPYGCVIFWGLSIAEEINFLNNMKVFTVEPVSDKELRENEDDMNFCYAFTNKGKNPKSIKTDEIVLASTSGLEKLSYSFAMAQSAKLFLFEERLSNIIEETKKYPEELSCSGKIQLNATQMNKLIGRVLVERNEVNLHSDVLDQPEFFWETQTWEPEYQRLCSYLDMPLRINLINKRLDVLRELLDVLHNQVTNTHAIRLEVIIIYLILLEVLIELVWNVIIKDIFGFFK